MLSKKKIIFLFLWLITILVSIIWTFENSDKIQALKDIIKNEKVDQNKELNINSAYYSLNLKKFKTPVYSKYGGIEKIGNKIYYLSGDLNFYQLKHYKDDKKYDFISLPIEKIINNKEKFLEKNNQILGKKAWKFFGVKDILIEKFQSFDSKVLIVSSLNYYKDKDCYDLSVFLTEIINENSFQISEWEKIFSSEMCLNINLTKKPKFAAGSAGGRIVKFDDENILLSIGDFYADGVNGPMLSQDLNNDYGKIFKININNKKHEIFSYGHRNPQGLYIDKEKNIFSTEHGPRGGDEMNLIKINNNYGWPYATFGTNYKSYNAYANDIKKLDDNSKRIWPIDKTNNTHDDFTKPIFSWGNTFGVSNLIVYENRYFDKWNKNIIVSSLAGKQLARFVYDYNNNSILYLENILINKRIRDIISLENGNIVLLTDIGDEITEHAEIILLSKSKN
tara:strand:+ start:2595 stop:3944 length:1350 start_codon:yes stop_codon:yes gene_type:complete